MLRAAEGADELDRRELQSVDVQSTEEGKGAAFEYNTVGFWISKDGIIAKRK